MSIRNKVILAETSTDSPALAARGGLLFIAWKGSGNDNLNIMFSEDNGHSFKGKHISREASDSQPALTVHNEVLFIAWKGSGNDNLNVARVATSGGPPGNVSIEGLVESRRLMKRPAPVRRSLHTAASCLSAGKDQATTT